MSSPRFHHVRVRRDEPVIQDVRAHTERELASCGVTLGAGGRVAIAVGSRGIRDLVPVVAAVAGWVRSQGNEPFLVPAMGSHGGATAEGQAEVLASLGLADPSLRLPIESSMDVVELRKGSAPVPVVTDARAAAADATILVNRVKPHTDFHGPYESGLVKMAAIGLGKKAQADALHAHGVRGLRELMPRVGQRVLETSNIALGVAIVENADDGTMLVEAIPSARILSRERDLIEIARQHLPLLPVDQLDVLLVDRMGKDVSGVGMDTNVIGRLLIAGQDEPASPRISMIACHALTPASHGNATGMGLADVITRAMAAEIDHDVTRTNIVTSGFLLRGKLPVVADDDRQAWELCLRGAGVVDAGAVRAARIVDTAHGSELWVSDAVLPELATRGDIVVLRRDLDLHDAHGQLRPFAAAAASA